MNSSDSTNGRRTATAIAFTTAMSLVAGLLLSGCGQSSQADKPVREVRGAPIKSVAEKPAATAASPQTQAASRETPAASTASTASNAPVLSAAPASASPTPSPAPATGGAVAGTAAGSSSTPATPTPAPASTSAVVTASTATATVAAPATAADGRPVALGFDLLSGYTFEVSDELLGPVTNDVAAAAQKTNAQIPPTVKSYDRKKVALRGFMLPLKVEGGLVTEMLIMKDQSMCCFGTAPRINDWVSVRMKNKGVRPTMDIPVTLSGTMRVGEMRENGYLVGIYSLDGESMEAPEQ